MAQIFAALPGMKGLMAYWYHFAIMFEALFILTTVDSGTRVGRFLVQEFGGRAWKRLGDAEWLPGSLGATAFMVLCWGYFIWTGSINTSGRCSASRTSCSARSRSPSRRPS